MVTNDNWNSSRAFRWLFIGSGRIAKKTAMEITVTGRHCISYVYSRNKETASNLAMKYCAIHADNLHDVDCNAIDGIYIATPQSSHYEYVVRCSNMKKPILVEKPFVVNMKEYMGVKHIEIEKGILIVEAMCMLYNPLLPKIKSEVDNIEDIKYIELKYAMAMEYLMHMPRLTDCRYAGGSLMEIGVYAIAFCNYLFEKMPSSLNIKANIKAGIDYDDKIILTYGRVPCYIHISLNKFRGFPKARIKCNKKEIIVPKFSSPEKYYVRCGGQRIEYNNKEGKYIFEFDALAENSRMAKETNNGLTMCTENTIRCIDYCRRKIGVIFPNDAD